jgi:hypothetical protein
VTPSGSHFNTSLRRDPSQPRDLIARVDAGVRERIGEAVDSVCLEVMVESRRARGLPAPAPDSARDRAEFDADVETFLAKLADEIPATLGEEQRRSPEIAAERAGQDRLARLLAAQVALAKLLPDYWQRFNAVRAVYSAESLAGATPTSGGDRPGWLGRLLGG